MINKALGAFLQNFDLKESQKFENMVVFPILSATTYDFDYLTLSEAIEKGCIEITEISSGGSVPEIKVINRGDIPVLLVDGEELKGAKQNRILNTTILVREKSETIIPVSCTEHGRWSDISSGFAESGNILSSHMRREKTQDVEKSLKDSHSFRSDQGKIWNMISNLSRDTNVHPATGAMNDVYQAKHNDLNDYVDHFELLSGQTGLVVFINGRIIGMDIFSKPSVYARLHRKLLRSYAMDAISGSKTDHKQSGKDDALAFIKEIEQAEEEKFRSPGYGWDHRFRGETIIGSALIHEDMVIHLTCFAIRKREEDSRLADVMSRIRFCR